MAHAGLAGPGPQSHPLVWAPWLSATPGEPGGEEHQAGMRTRCSSPRKMPPPGPLCLWDLPGVLWDLPGVLCSVSFLSSHVLARLSTRAMQGQQPKPWCCQQPGEAATSPRASHGTQQPSRNVTMVSTNPHLQHRHCVTSAIHPQKLPLLSPHSRL